MMKPSIMRLLKLNSLLSSLAAAIERVSDRPMRRRRRSPNRRLSSSTCWSVQRTERVPLTRPTKPTEKSSFAGRQSAVWKKERNVVRRPERSAALTCAASSSLLPRLRLSTRHTRSPFERTFARAHTLVRAGGASDLLHPGLEKTRYFARTRTLKHVAPL